MRPKILVGLLVLVGSLLAGNGDAWARESGKENKKQLQKEAQVALFEQAAEALRSGAFVLEADQVQICNSKTSYVPRATNYVLMDRSGGMFQLADVNGQSLTMGGSVSDTVTRVSKRGDVTLQYQVQGNGASGSVVITLPYGTNQAIARLSGTFAHGQLMVRGKLLPASRSEVYKGRTHIATPLPFNASVNVHQQF